MGVVQDYFKEKGLKTLEREEEEDCILTLIDAHENSMKAMKNFKRLVSYINSKWYLRWILEKAYESESLDDN